MRYVLDDKNVAQRGARTTATRLSSAAIHSGIFPGAVSRVFSARPCASSLIDGTTLHGRERVPGASSTPPWWLAK